MSETDMTLPADRWSRNKELFGSALARPVAERASLDRACGPTESDIRREVESLLAAHQTSDSFVATPAAAVAGPMTSHGRGLTEGQILGPYRVLRTLGQGGMATVYLVHDERHRRSVALKVLRPDLAHILGPERFLREIAIAAQLNHPHILASYDSGEADGVLYYVMPYIKGESLRHRLAREKAEIDGFEPLYKGTRQTSAHRLKNGFGA